MGHGVGHPSEPTFEGVPDELRKLLSWQHNVITLQQAVAHLSRGTVRHMVDSGRWRQAHAGIFSTHTGPLAAEQRLWVASLAGGDGEPALLGGRTALGLLGLRGFEPDRIDVLIPARRRADSPPRNVVVHRTTSLPPADVLVRSRPPCTTAARSIVDAASWARSDREASTVVAMAFQQQLVGLDEVRAVVDRLPRAKRRRLTLATAQDAAEGSHSLGEVEMARLLRRHRLPPPTRQAARVDAGPGAPRPPPRRPGPPRAPTAGTSTCSSRNTASTLRSTARITSTPRRRGWTWTGRTRCGCRASGSCASRRG